MSRRGKAISNSAAKRKARFEGAMLVVGHPVQTYEMAEERREDCAHYRECLGYAIKKDWTNFSCTECPDFALSTAETRMAAEGINASFANAKRM